MIKRLKVSRATIVCKINGPPDSFLLETIDQRWIHKSEFFYPHFKAQTSTMDVGKGTVYFA